MLDNNLTASQFFIVAVIPILFAIVLHEVAHGWTAYKLGDRTAMMLGRLSLNPIKHIDPIGTILVPIVLYLTAGFIFGWAKPVPIDWRNLKNPKRDTALVAIAGPAANLAMALFWGIIIFIATSLSSGLSSFYAPLANMAAIGIFINILLMIFNLIPIPPTDGGRIAVSLLPANLGRLLSNIEPFGLLIIVFLIVSGFFSNFILPITNSLSIFIYEFFAI